MIDDETTPDTQPRGSRPSSSTNAGPNTTQPDPGHACACMIDDETTPGSTGPEPRPVPKVLAPAGPGQNSDAGYQRFIDSSAAPPLLQASRPGVYLSDEAATACAVWADHLPEADAVCLAWDARYPAGGLDVVPDVDPARRHLQAPATQRDTDRAIGATVGGVDDGGLQNGAEFDVVATVDGRSYRLRALLDTGARIDFINTSRVALPASALGEAVPMRLTGLGASRNVDTHDVPGAVVTVPGDGPELSAPGLLALESALPYDLVLGQRFWFRHRANLVYTDDDPLTPVAGMSFEGHAGRWMHDLTPVPAARPDPDNAELVAAIAEAAEYAGIEVVSAADLYSESAPGAPNTDGLRISIEVAPPDGGAIGAVADDAGADAAPFRLEDRQLPADAQQRAAMEDMLHPFIAASPKSDEDMPHAADTPLFKAGLHAQRTSIKASADPDLIPAARPFRIARDSQMQLDIFLKRMVEKGYIRRSTSAWSSPIFVVPKKGTTSVIMEDGTERTMQKIRIVNDFRVLNSLTRKDGYGAPNLDQQRDRLAGFAYASSLDLRQSFFQLPLEETSRKYTGFCTANGSWECCVVPMGTRNASAAFSRTINTLLLPHAAYTASYIDDIVVYSSSFDEHVAHLKAVLTTLVDQCGLCLNLQKCEFGLPQVTFLGYVLTASADGTRCQLDPDLITAMSESARPRSPKEARALLGLANCFAPWIPRFAEIAGPLQCLRGNNLKQSHFNALWNGKDGGGAMLSCFEQLRSALSSPPLVMLPDPAKEYTVITDSSQEQVGGMACQPAEDGTLLPVGFFSQKLSKHRSTWSICFKELLAVVLCCRRFRCLVGFQDFVVCTDHEPLIHFLGDRPQPNVSWVQARMLEEVAGYNMTISYLPGRLNIFADYLSRVKRGDPTGPVQASQADIIPGRRMAINEEGLEEEDEDFPDNGVPFAAAVSVDAVDTARIVAGHAHDPHSADIIRVLTDAGMTRHHHCHKCLLSASGVIQLRPHPQALFRSPTTLVASPSPTESPAAATEADALKQSIVRLFHEAGGHYRDEVTLASVRDHYFWKGMARDVSNFVKSCEACCLNADSPPGLAGYYQPSAAPSPGSIPWRCVSFDFVTGGLPEMQCKGRACGQILVISDQLSRLVKILPCPINITAAGVAELYYEEVFPTLGMPAEIKGDRDVLFVADFFQALMAQLGVTVRLSAPYSSRSNGLVERSNREVVRLIRIAISKHSVNWAQRCAVFEFQMNRRRTRSRDGLSPFEIAYGWLPRGATDPVPSDLTSNTAVDGRTTADAQRAAGVRAGLAISFEADRIAKRANATIRRADIVVGDWVMLARRAFTPPSDRDTAGHKYRSLFNGPFEVVATSKKGNTIRLDMRDVPSSTRAGDVFNLQHVYRCEAPRGVSAEQAGAASSGCPTALVKEVLKHKPESESGPATWTVSWLSKGSQANSAHQLTDFLSPPAQGLDAVHPLLQRYERARTNATPVFDLLWAYPDRPDWLHGTTRLMPDGYLVLKSAGGRATTLGSVARAHEVEPCRLKRINKGNPFWERLHPGRALTLDSTLNKGLLFRLRVVTPASNAAVPLTSTHLPPPTPGATTAPPTRATRRAEALFPGWLKPGAPVLAEETRYIARGNDGPTDNLPAVWEPATVLSVDRRGRAKIHFDGWSSSWDVFREHTQLRPNPRA